jgi:hypothetical protein
MTIPQAMVSASRLVHPLRAGFFVLHRCVQWAEVNSWVELWNSREMATTIRQENRWPAEAPFGLINQ